LDNFIVPPRFQRLAGDIMAYSFSSINKGVSVPNLPMGHAQQQKVLGFSLNQHK
jgi:hypothetical protein